MPNRFQIDPKSIPKAIPNRSQIDPKTLFRKVFSLGVRNSYPKKIVKTMPKRCQNDVKTMSKRCQNDVKTMLKRCQVDVKTMSKRCQVDAKTMSKQCQVDVKPMDEGWTGSAARDGRSRERVQGKPDGCVGAEWARCGEGPLMKIYT